MKAHIRLSLWSLLAAATLAAAPPVLEELVPRGAQKGRTFTLLLRGDALVAGAMIESTLPATFSRLTRSQDPLAEMATAPNQSLAYLVSLKADAAPGVYPIRLLTKGGLSNILLFTVGEFPETEEEESRDRRKRNDSAVAAQRVPVPGVVSGTLTAQDIDQYVFTAKAGQKLVIEAIARRAGSAIDPAVEIFDSTGKEIAKNDDAPGAGVDSRLEFTFAKAGDYRVQIHDSKYSDQDQNFYRLQIGAYKFAENAFPLGWKRGEAAKVSLSGGNLGVETAAALDGGKPGMGWLRLAGSPSLPMPFVLSDQNEEMEAATGGGKLTAGTVVNGRIEKPKEVDRYSLSVEPGQKWVFEVSAAQLGTSQLDGLLTVYDSKGKKLASADDGDGIDPVLPFTVPNDVRVVTVAIEDLLGRGGHGYAYRLQANRKGPDFSVDLATPFVNVPAGGTATVVVQVQRRGYLGDVRLRILNLPEGFEAAGGHVPAESAAQSFNNDNSGRRRETSVISITALPGAAAQRLDLQIAGVGRDESGPIVRTARTPGIVTAVKGERQRPMTAPWLNVGLGMSLAEQLPAAVGAPSTLVRISQGVEYKLEYKVDKRAGASTKGTVSQNVAGAVGNLRILRGPESKSPDTGSYLVNTNFATPLTTFDMVLQTQADVNGKTITIPSKVISIEVVPGFEVKLARETLDVAPGAKAAVSGTVWREFTFEGGLIRVAADDLPDGVTCPAVEVPADQRQFTLSCEAGPQVKPGSYPIRITSTAPDTGKKAKADYKIADIPAKVVISGVTKAAR